MKKQLFAALASLVVFTGCEKEPAAIFSEEVATSVNSAAIDMQLLHHLWTYSNAICTEYETGSFFCWNGISDSVSGNNVMLEYNFDTYQLYGCGYYDTAYTGGRMKITYTSPLASADSLVLDLINFHVSGNTYNGMVHINRQNPLIPVVSTTGLQVTRGELAYTVNATVNVQILTGSHSITGNSSASGGQDYTFEIQTPLLITAPQTQSSYFNAGNALFKHPKQEAKINYGNGQEDNLATCVLPDGLRYVLKLHPF